MHCMAGSILCVKDTQKHVIIAPSLRCVYCLHDLMANEVPDIF